MKKIIYLLVVVVMLFSAKVCNSAKVSGLHTWVDRSTPTAALWNANDAAFTTAIDNVESVQIVDGTIVNADIANTTIDLTAKVTGILPKANGGTATADSTLNSFYVDLPDGTVGVPALNWAGDLDTGFYLISANRIGIVGNGLPMIDIAPTLMDFYLSGVNKLELSGVTLKPIVANGLDLGTATEYYSTVHYVTLTSHSLGYYDDGVELLNGEFVSDTEAIKQLKPHGTKITKEGKPMLDKKTFPKDCYVPAEKDGKILPRDENDNPYYMDKNNEKMVVEHGDSINVTALQSIMIGAIKELTLRVETLEQKVAILENQ